jgi:hypothetical protein
MFLWFTVRAQTEFGVIVELDVIAAAWPCADYVAERVRDSIGIALLGGARVRA